MVAKGHHFAGVELAAVIDADTALGAAGLPRRGADVPADHAARRPQRPRRARPRARPDVPAGRAADRATPRATTSRGFLDRGARAPARRSATRRSATSSASSSPAPSPSRSVRALEELQAPASRGAELLGPAPLLRLRGRHRAQLVAKTDRPRAVAAQAAAAARRRRAGDAARRADRRRRRRPADRSDRRQTARHEGHDAEQVSCDRWHTAA